MTHGRWHGFQECGRTELRSQFRWQDNSMMASLGDKSPCRFPEWIADRSWLLVGTLSLSQVTLPCRLGFASWLHHICLKFFLLKVQHLNSCLSSFFFFFFCPSPPCVSLLVPISTLNVYISFSGLWLYTMFLTAPPSLPPSHEFWAFLCIWFIHSFIHSSFICTYMEVLICILVSACESKLRLGSFLSQLPLCVLRQSPSSKFSIWQFS